MKEAIVLVLLIINLTLSIYNFICLRKLKPSKEENKKEKELVSNDYLYTLEFNTELDNLIQPLLNKNSNDDIKNKVFNNIIKKEKYSDIDKDILKKHISDTLLNYINNYNEHPVEIDEENIEAPYPLLDDRINISNKYNRNLEKDDNTDNLSNVLQNFYD